MGSSVGFGIAFFVDLWYTTAGGRVRQILCGWRTFLPSTHVQEGWSYHVAVCIW